jgi:hypothetical protein
MQRDRHHLAALSIETIESVLEVLEVGVASGADESWRHVEFPIVA